MIERKAFKDCAIAQKQRHKRAIKQMLNSNLEFLKSIGLKYKNIILEEIEIDNEPNLGQFDLKICYNNEEGQQITNRKALVEKDRILMSDKSYHQFRKNLTLNVLPTLSSLVKKRIEFEKDNIFLTSHTPHGSINNICKVLSYRIKKNEINDNIIRVKFCADGKIISRKVKLINITCTILNEGNWLKLKNKCIKFQLRFSLIII